MRYETERTRRRGHPDSSMKALAGGLGWFSVILGVIEVAAPGALARRLGLHGAEGLVRAYGVREIVTGIGILTARDPTPWVWARVGGDALDMATLASALGRDNRRREQAAVALAAVAGVSALDAYCAATLSSESPVPLPPMRDYSDRRGFPQAPDAMRGAARRDGFEVPRDMRAPEALQSWKRSQDFGRSAYAGA